MIFNITANNQQIKAKKGETILSALTRNGIHVPTLCYMPELNPTGACRICAVEVEGKNNLVPACSHPVEEWMVILTHSPKVINARKTIVELLLASHPDDCLYCERNQNCELQSLASELNIRERKLPRKEISGKIDKSSPGIVKDKTKCILCGRCVRMCEEIIGVSTFDFIDKGSETITGTSFNKPLNVSNCVFCGQCTLVCPTGALYEKSEIEEVQRAIHNPEIYPVAQVSPATAASFAQMLGIKSYMDALGIVNSALLKCGFNKVFDTSFANDIVSIEIAEEIIQKQTQENPLPLFSSCCPAWIKYSIAMHGELSGQISPVNSPQQILGKLIKSSFAESEKLKAGKIFHVEIVSCPSKKAEAKSENVLPNGASTTDAVLTIREFIKLIRINGIDLNLCYPIPSHSPYGTRSSAGILHDVSGGLSEAVARVIHFKFTGKELKDSDIQRSRNLKLRKEFRLKVKNRTYTFIAVSTFIELEKVLTEIKEGRKDISFIEVMACPSGCINGGGNPINRVDSVLKNKIKMIYDSDDKEGLKLPLKNPSIIQLYDNYLSKLSAEARAKVIMPDRS